MEQFICQKLLDMMEERPYDRIKVTELVKYAGIGRSTFYSHFDSIYAVVQKIEDDFLVGLPDEITCTRETVNDRRTRLGYFNHLKDNKRVYRILNGPNRDPSFRIRLMNRTRRILLTHVASPTKTPHEAAEQRILCEFLQGGYEHMITWWLEHADEFSAHEMVVLTETLSNCLYRYL